VSRKVGALRAERGDEDKALFDEELFCSVDESLNVLYGENLEDAEQEARGQTAVVGQFVGLVFVDFSKADRRGDDGE